MSGSHPTKEQRDRERTIREHPLAVRCQDCGKLRFPNRKAAKRTATSMRSDGPLLGVYRCGDYWHIGHTPQQVRQGWRPR